MTRDEKILQLVNRAGKGLEIGPSYSPITPRSQGWDVEVADHLDAKGLREKYIAWAVDVSKVEEVDHVVTDKSLAETVGKPDYFDFIIASHVIEHSPDLVGFLKDCETLLKPGGILSLVVPDKRFCFDVYKSLTSTGDVFQAYLEKRKRHAPGTIFDAYAYHAMAGHEIVGFDRHRQDLTLAHDVKQSLDLTQQFIDSDIYIDTHAWNFTPSSFSLIVQDLNELGFINLGKVLFHGTVGFEFYVSLRKGDRGEITPRIELLRSISEEL